MASDSLRVVYEASLGGEQLRISAGGARTVTKKDDVVRVLDSEASPGSDVALWNKATSGVTAPQLFIIAVDPDGTDASSSQEADIEITGDAVAMAFRMKSGEVCILPGPEVGDDAGDVDGDWTSIIARNPNGTGGEDMTIRCIAVE